ncbi:hypothetical protein Pan216_23320 [Planctomycetes bacterium Pan216]|uniref:MotA/TolQ/ExbB proton channel domain-containing protein n=1 Tax=Kolteria novifilia TaxID=2527975 RepID=A0A518B3F9_9BACT|nr:hypothetical protein Pan216_23320 [Planctomycetes bacterium Pan216]
MYFEFVCTKCDKKLKVREENIGRRVRCPYCHHSQVVSRDESPEDDKMPWDAGADSPSKPSSPDQSPAVGGEKRPAPSGKSSTTQHSGGSESGESCTEVSLGFSAAVGFAIFVVFYGALFPFRHLFIGELFYERGWVPIALVFLMGWSAAILVLKQRKLSRQKESMLFDLLPNDIGELITVKNAGEFTKHVRSLPVQPTESFLVNRVLRGLEHFRVLKSNPEVADRLSSQSDIDANAVGSSYTMLKVFIWAIPILGFIGTVMGISDAVGGFSGSLSGAQDISVLKDSLNSVTGGLATAFDTTLIALVMSICVMIPTSTMQKSEEDLLNWVDEYCNENLLKRLKDVNRDRPTTASIDEGAMQQAIDGAMANHHAELRTWTKKLEAIGATLGDENRKSWKEIDDQLQVRQTKYLKQVDTLAAKLGEKQASIVGSLESVGRSLADTQRLLAENFSQVSKAAEARAEATLVEAEQERQKVEGGLADLVRELRDSIEGLTQSTRKSSETTMELIGQVAERSIDAQSEMIDSVRKSSHELTECLGNVETGVSSLNGVLERLGERQVVVENRIEPRRGGWSFFSRSNGS